MIEGFFYPWGMPLFFLIAGAGSWFALRRRSAGQFTRERTLRLLVPFFTGTLLLGPIQLYLSWRHRTQTGVFDGSLLEFVADPPVAHRPQALRGDRVPYVVSGLPVRLLAAGSPAFHLAQGGSGPALHLTLGRAVRASRRHPALHPPARRSATGPPALLPPKARLGRFLLLRRVFRPGLPDLHRRAVHPGDPARLARSCSASASRPRWRGRR